MIRMKLFVFVVLSIFSNVSCSGYMEIRLKSEVRQDVTVIVSNKLNPTYITLPIALQAGKARELGAFPIDFQEDYTLIIHGERTETLGLNGSSYTANFKPNRGKLSPKQLHLPLNGLELIFECDKNWYGYKCDISCEKDCNSHHLEKDLIITTDYTVDMTKMPEIVKRLKETTKVDNAIRNENEELKRRNQNEEDSFGTATRPKDSRKSILGDVFKTIFAMDGNSDSETENEMNPMAMIQRMIVQKRGEEVVHAKEIDKHTSFQKKLGMRHQKPVRFASWEGPGEGMGALPMFGSLMKLMPRLARNAVEKEAIDGSGTGAAADDFAIDQIIKN